MPATPLPAQGEPTPEAKTCDAGGMAMIHRFFRAEFGEAPDLVRGVTPGDTAHAAVVADHLALISHGLHTHHESEDLMLWDTLAERAPACAVHVERMKLEHAQMLEHLTSLDLAIPPWKAGATHPDAVLVALDGINEALAVHLPDEEGNIVPVMEHTLSPDEIEALSRHGDSAIPKDKMWIVLGAIMAAQPDAGASFLKDELPPPARMLWRLVGKRRYEKNRAALVGAGR